MWRYSQSTGTLTAPDGSVAGHGYSGHGPGINNPAMQNVPDVGPIPVGMYTIGPFRSDPEKGPLVCDLIPDPANEGCMRMPNEQDIGIGKAQLSRPALGIFGAIAVQLV